MYNLHTYIIRYDIEVCKFIFKEIDYDLIGDNPNHLSVILMYYVMLRNTEKAYQIIEKLKKLELNDLERSRLLHSEGELLLIEKRYKEAEEKLFDSLEDIKNFINTIDKSDLDFYTLILQFQGIIFNSLGSMYYNISDFIKSEYYFDEARKFFYDYRNINRDVRCNYNLSVIYIVRNNLHKAEKTLKRIENMNMEFDIYIQLNLVYIYYRYEEYHEALYTLNKISIEKFNENPLLNIDTLNNLYALVYKGLNQTDNAYEHLEKININTENIPKRSKYIYDLSRLIVKEDFSEDSVKYVKEEILPYFINIKHTGYVNEAMKFLEGVR